MGSAHRSGGVGDRPGDGAGEGVEPLGTVPVAKTRRSPRRRGTRRSLRWPPDRRTRSALPGSACEPTTGLSRRAGAGTGVRCRPRGASRPVGSGESDRWRTRSTTGTWRRRSTIWSPPSGGTCWSGWRRGLPELVLDDGRVREVEVTVHKPQAPMALVLRRVGDGQAVSLTRAAVALGSNLGDRAATFESALGALAQLEVVVAVSGFHETAPVGGPSRAISSTQWS